MISYNWDPAGTGRCWVAELGPGPGVLSIDGKAYYLNAELFWWCLNCERVHRRLDWIQESGCPTEGCQSKPVAIWPWSFHVANNGYPNTPKAGSEYPLWPVVSVAASFKTRRSK